MVCETCVEGCYLKSHGVCGISAVTLSISVPLFFLLQHISKSKTEDDSWANYFRSLCKLERGPQWHSG